MLETYSKYIAAYIIGAEDDLPRPGEHHFVAVYLLPRLNQITKRIPYYVNPDGMKHATGDVIYRSGARLRLSVEAKYDVVRLTTKEFNESICGAEREWPAVFIGVCAQGLVIFEWRQLRRTYLKWKFKGRTPKPIAPESYGPQLKVKRLIDAGGAGIFPFVPKSRAAAKRAEAEFIAALKTAVSHVARWN